MSMTARLLLVSDAEISALDPSERGYFTEAYESLRALIRKGSADGSGLLVWLS